MPEAESTVDDCCGVCMPYAGLAGRAAVWRLLVRLGRMILPYEGLTRFLWKTRSLRFLFKVERESDLLVWILAAIDTSRLDLVFRDCESLA
jgi:hypothetical protein